MVAFVFYTALKLSLELGKIEPSPRRCPQPSFGVGFDAATPHSHFIPSDIKRCPGTVQNQSVSYIAETLACKARATQEHVCVQPIRLGVPGRNAERGRLELHPTGLVRAGLRKPPFGRLRLCLSPSLSLSAQTIGKITATTTDVPLFPNRFYRQ
jgi:hypothetical protein